MVQRDLTQVVTPSTRLDGNLRPEAVHLLALREVCVGIKLYRFSFSGIVWVQFESFFIKLLASIVIG